MEWHVGILATRTVQKFGSNSRIRREGLVSGLGIWIFPTPRLVSLSPGLIREASIEETYIIRHAKVR